MPEPMHAASLDDLGGALFPVTVKRPDGRAVIVELRELSEGQMWDLRRAVKWPRPPVAAVTKTSQVYDYQDPAYIAGVEDANRRFAQLTLLACLPFVVAGETEGERMATLQARVGQYVYSQLIEAAQRINVIMPQEIAAVADSFRRARDGGAPGHGSTQPDPEPVALVE